LYRESVDHKCEQLNLLDPVRDCADAHGRARKEDPGYPGITTLGYQIGYVPEYYSITPGTP
jgi:hypothetical protein